MYQPDNPGAPISYNVAFLKDNVLATMGFTTHYTETSSKRLNNGYVRVNHQGGYVGRFTVSWDQGDANGNLVPQMWQSGDKSAGYSYQIDLPGDAVNVRIRGEAATGLVWQPWKDAMNVVESGPTNKCYRIYGSTLDPNYDNNC